MSTTRIIFLFTFLFLAETLYGQNSKKALELYEEAESAYSDGRYKDAVTLLNESIQLNPGNMEAYALRGNAREILLDNNGALTDFSIYLDKFPEHRDLLLNRAVIRYKVGFYDQAIEDFKRLLTLPGGGETNSLFYKKQMSVDDKNPIVSLSQGNDHFSYIYNYIGLCYYKMKNAQSALTFFDTAISLNTREPDYYVNRGLSKEVLKDSTASLDYQAALKLSPNHVLAKHNLDALQQKKLQSMSLEERLSQTIGADSTMLYPYLERAQQRYEAKYYQGAIDDYDDALEIDPGNVEIWLGRGLAKEKLKDYKGAYSDYTKAIDLKEDYAKAWLNRGNVLLKQERYADAVEDYNVAITYNENYSAAFYNRAMARIKLKKNADACSDLNKAEALGMAIDDKVKSKACNPK